MRATGISVTDVSDVVTRHGHVRGLRQLERVLDLVDPGSQSPKETWLRLLLIDGGFPRPNTQIPVRAANGWTIYYLDMGWEDARVAVEYDGDQHRTDRTQYVKDIRRADALAALGWTLIRVVAEDSRASILRRVRSALDRNP